MSTVPDLATTPSNRHPSGYSLAQPTQGYTVRRQEKPASVVIPGS
jgi:hypothetical protein